MNVKKKDEIKEIVQEFLARPVGVNHEIKDIRRDVSRHSRHITALLEYLNIEICSKPEQLYCRKRKETDDG